MTTLDITVRAAVGPTWEPAKTIIARVSCWAPTTVRSALARAAAAGRIERRIIDTVPTRITAEYRAFTIDGVPLHACTQDALWREYDAGLRIDTDFGLAAYGNAKLLAIEAHLDDPSKIPRTPPKQDARS